MNALVRIIVDNRSLQVDPAIPLLQALRLHDIHLPSLCYHPRLGEQGRCSLCVVEVNNGGGDWRAEHACMLRGEPELTIRTVSARIHRLRSFAARMLLARGPFAEPSAGILLQGVLTAAETTGSGEGCPETQVPPIFDVEDSVMPENGAASKTMPPGCILCGRCIAMCTRIGKNKLAFLGRGKTYRIGYVNSPGDTGGCGECHACRSVCPTAYITNNGQTTFSAKLYP